LQNLVAPSMEVVSSDVHINLAETFNHIL